MSLNFDDFKKNCRFRHQRGIPDILVVAVVLLFDQQVLDFYIKHVLMMFNSTCLIEKWPKDLNDSFYLYIHKLIPKNDNTFVDQDQLYHRIVIRRNLELPMVMSIFRRNAMQHVRFFHDFLFQTVSYAKVPDSEGRYPTFELNFQFLKKIKPLFAQLCDPYTSYN